MKSPAGERLQNAVTTMQKAPNFSFTGDVTRNGGAPIHLRGEFSAPASVHQIVTGTPAGTVELMFVGAKVYRKTPTGTWVAAASTSTTAGATPRSDDPRTAFKTLTKASGVEAPTANDMTFKLAGASAAALVPGAKNVEGKITLTGLYITTLEYHGDDAAHSNVALHYDHIGTTPVVTAPA